MLQGLDASEPDALILRSRIAKIPLAPSLPLPRSLLTHHHMIVNTETQKIA